MYRTSQFCLEDQTKTSSANQNKLNSDSIIQTTEKSNDKSPDSQYRCEMCKDHLQIIKHLKNQQIRTEYEFQKYKLSNDKLRRQNQHLLSLKMNQISTSLLKNNSAYYCKQDIQNELSQAKYLIELLTLSKSKNNQLYHPKQSKKQAQYLHSISKHSKVQIKKSEDLLLQNMKLQQIIMIKDKIIQQKVLFPLYHYDERILMLRKGVDFWYKKAEQYCSALKQQMLQLTRNQMNFKKQVEIILKYQKSLWENQVKSSIGKFYQSKYLSKIQGGKTNQLIQNRQFESQNQSFIVNKTKQNKHLSAKTQFQSAKSQKLADKTQILSAKAQNLSAITQIKDKSKSLLSKNNKRQKPQQSKKAKRISLSHKCSKQTTPTTNYNCLRCQNRLKGQQ